MIVTGVVALDFSPIAIRVAFAVQPNNNPMFALNFKSLAPARTLNIFTNMLKWFNKESKQDLIDLPMKKILVPDTNSFIGWLLSMITILCGEESDKYMNLH